MDHPMAGLARRQRVTLPLVVFPPRSPDGDQAHPDLLGAIAEAEERGNWRLAAELRGRPRAAPAASGGASAGVPERGSGSGADAAAAPPNRAARLTLLSRLTELAYLLSGCRATRLGEVRERAAELRELYQAARLDDDFVAALLTRLARDLSVPGPGFEASYYARQVSAAADRVARW